MTDRFVLYDETMRNPPPMEPFDPAKMGPPPISTHRPEALATAEDELDARAVGATFAGRADLTWIEYQLEDDGTTHCNGVVRDDLPPHTP
jgi:hypothetical protein